MIYVIIAGTVIQFTSKSDTSLTGNDIIEDDLPLETPLETENEKLDDTEYEISEDDEFTNSSEDVVISKVTKKEEGYTIDYNGSIYNMTLIQEDNLYLSLAGYITNEDGQCYSDNFVLNKKTKTIENSKGISINFIRTGKGYYFVSGKCEPLDYPGDVYSSSWNLLGMYLGDAYLDNGNIFVSKQDNTKRAKGLIEYDVNGNVVSELDDYYYSYAIVYEDEVYTIALDETKVYIINLNTSDKTEICDINTNRDLTYNFYDRMEFNGTTIHLTLEEGQFEYNVTTKEVTNL